MGRTVLLGCYEAPGWGGASTATYRLLQVLRSLGLDAHYVTLVDEEDADYYRFVFGSGFGNPLCLPDVHSCLLQGRLYGPQPELGRLIAELAPAVMLGVGWLAALPMRRASPTRRLVLLTSGCQQMKELIASGEARDFVSQRAALERAGVRPRVQHREEEEAVAGADLVITHAEMIRFLLCAFFPAHAGKVWPEIIGFGEWIYGEARSYAHLARPFAERDVDVLFVASSWARPEKNYPLVRRIVPGLRGARVHVVGDVDQPCPGATHHGLVADRATLFGLMGRARTVVCPSLFDAAPGILFEAAALGCNVVASRNCGNWELCHQELLAAGMAPQEFTGAIAASLVHKYEDNMPLFLEAAASRRLAEVLSAL